MTSHSDKIERAMLIEHMLESLESPSKELTKWEEDFVENIREGYAQYKRLTERQFEILEKIYAEKTS